MPDAPAAPGGTTRLNKRMAELGMGAPADNTPEKYEAYLKSETVRQGEIAKLTGAALQK